MSKIRPILYGFFHPYCNAGGGGERVLWQAVEDTLKFDEECKVIIYSGDTDSSVSKILANVVKRFNIKLDEKRLIFNFLKKRHLVDPRTWPSLTLLGQAFGSMILSYEAIKSFEFKPDVWIDTMGYPFSYPIVYLFLQIPIIAYVHFPVISKDMLNKLNFSLSIYGVKQLLKYIYWYSFLIAYKLVGRLVDITLTNSSWTNNHIKSIWTLNRDITILYPPCSTENFVNPEEFNNKEKWTRDNSIVVLAQFRPEKRHLLIIEQYSIFLSQLAEISVAPKLILIGSIRNDNDKDYVNELKEKSRKLKIPSSHIEFQLDLPFNEVLKFLRTSSYGLNAMWNEHFGIAVVEYVANGLIPIVHASAGPYLDIVVPWDSKLQKQVESTEASRTGFFFKDKSDPDYKLGFDELNEVFKKIINLSDEEKMEMSKRGQNCVLEKFSNKKFDNEWNRSLSKIPELYYYNKTTLFIWIIVAIISFTFTQIL
ncbi:hypothetical protein WICMUC_004844 [Wickerhamomyces mucosus]|uniref:GDP-Man:Man(3)GlcNAc(2)-PP-Dol alpha-1,2-mannosyltransferase n=1 Tax=Wickerhamomyces mucosus TaxID=1378264 RepID=A0A9P8PDN9_9ASCO|nr:hypothetical protein WICMUC_004844 [Wickerhamomyces mucosus]